MSLTVVLALGFGSLKDGFPHVTSELKKQGETVAQYLGSLLPAPEVEELHKRKIQKKFKNIWAIAVN